MIEEHSHIGARTSWVDLGNGTRTIRADARNNFPDAATATGSATVNARRIRGEP